ncbi:hypothetical protein D0863_03213 [Hortaea werneckii]|uniref:PHD-type domain-containing protein n=1 Tax=Hortaea werneckii TaxID=91943 RepID=A0A3M7ECN5_HORWE|nr:hypothetical protein D0863_03213 [Hortaea werneckii]
MGQDMSSAAAGDGNIAVKGAADAAQKKLYSAQRESDTRIPSDPMISSLRKESQSSKKRKRDPELENAMSLSGSRTPPHRLSNTFHRDQESPIQTRVRSRSPLAADVRRDEYRRLRDHWSPTRWEDSARSSYFEGAQAHWNKDRTTSRLGRFSWSPASKNSRRWTPSPPARAFNRTLRQPSSPDRPVTSPPGREEESDRSAHWGTAVPPTERYLPKPSRRSPSPPRKDYRNLSWRRSRDSLASDLNHNHKSSPRQTSGQRQKVVSQHSLNNPTSPSESRNLIDFNGLKAVPTGPKTALQHSRTEAATPLADTDRSLPARPVLQNVDASVRAAPHAFLSSRWLPPQQATIQHLRGYFAKRSPESIFVDDFGYYLLFNDDEEGHSNMDRLVAETPHRDKLFGMYPLTLEAYHNGQRQPDSRPTTPFDSHQEQREEAAGLVANDSHQEDNVMGLSSQKERDVTRMKDVAEEISTTPKRMQPKSEASRLQSPSRTMNRQDFDDTSSVSARTGTPSELSASRGTRCHACNADSSMHSGDLMICSSCPRRWHRACHEDPPFAPVTNSNVSWQCRRCIKKQVPLPESSNKLRFSAASFEPVPNHSRAKHPGSQESTFQAENGTNVVREGTRTSALSANLLDTHRSDQKISERMSESIGGGPKFPKGSNAINPPDRHTHLDDPSTGALSHELAYAPDETGKGQHLEHYLNFEDDEASDLVERSFTQTTPTTVSAPQDTKAHSKMQFKRIKLSREPSKAGQSQGVASASSKDHPVLAPKLPAQEQRRQEVRNHKAKSAMHESEIQNAPEVPESPAELRNPLSNESAAADHFSQDGHLRQSIITTDVAAKPKAKRTKQSFVICSVCQENKAYTSNPLAKACCSMCKQQQQQEQITAKVGEQCTSSYKNTRIETQSSKATAVGSMRLSGQDRKEGTGFVQPMEAAKSKERSDDDQVNANGVDGESCQSLAANERSASTSLPAQTDLSNSTGLAAIPVNFQENRIEQTKTAHGLEAGASNDAEVSTSMRENGREEPPLDGCFTLENSRPTKRKRRNFTDGNFPGNSHARAKGSYIRLIGMALCEAPDHRLQLRGIAAWIAENIPSYDLGVGNWEHGLDVTLRAHVGDRGKMMFKTVDFKPGADDDRHGNKEWYQMHEALASTHERWDPDLKQAVSPLFASSEEATDVVDAAQREKASEEEHSVRRDNTPNDRQYEEATPIKALKSGSGKAKAANNLNGQIGSRPGKPSMTDLADPTRHVEVDENAASENTRVAEDSEDEPLHAVRRRYAVPEAQMKAPEPEVEKAQGITHSKERLSTPANAPTEAGCTPEMLQKTSTWETPASSAAGDDQSPLEPVTQDEHDETHTALSLFDEWSEYHPARQLDRRTKMAEIKGRPSRKAMFGKPALYSRLGSGEASQSGHSVNEIRNSSTEKPSEKQASSVRKVAHSIDPFPAERNVIYYDTLEEFFGLPQNPVPVMYNGQLAYRDGTKDHSSRVRKAQAYFPTGLGG